MTEKLPTTYEQALNYVVYMLTVSRGNSPHVQAALCELVAMLYGRNQHRVSSDMGKLLTSEGCQDAVRWVMEEGMHRKRD